MHAAVPGGEDPADTTAVQGERTAEAPNALVRAYEDWDGTSAQLVEAATIAFGFLLLPQVVKNAANVLAGNTAALAILSWVGFSTALAGNTLLLSYFLGKGERAAAQVQTIGAASNFVMLAQIFISGYMPQPAFAAVVAVVATAGVVNGAKVTGRLDASQGGRDFWELWQECLGLFGLVLLPQALFSTFVKSESLAPAAAAGAVSSALFAASRLGRLPGSLAPLMRNLLGWTATLLFMFQPLAQLINNFEVPTSLEGLSLGTILLATAGNGLMVPRALFTRDSIWLLGSAWGSFFGLLQLLSMFVGRTAAGQPYVGGLLFYSVTAAFVVCVLVVLSADARSKGVSFPLGPLGTLFATRQDSA